MIRTGFVRAPRVEPWTEHAFRADSSRALQVGELDHRPDEPWQNQEVPANMDRDVPTPAGFEPHGDRVELVVPPSSAFLRAVRLVSADAAVRAGCDVGEVDDFRVAMDELCHLLMTATDHFVRVSLTTHDRRVVGRGSATARPTARPPELDPVSEMLVRATTDRFSVTTSEDDIAFEVVKAVHRRERVPGTRPASSPR